MKYADYDELTHYGIKGMKWGVRRSKRSAAGKSSLKKSARESRMTDVKSKIHRGADVTKKFLKDNGPMIAKDAAIIAMSVVGFPYAAVIINNYAGLLIGDFKNPIISNDTTRETMVFDKQMSPEEVGRYIEGMG